MRISIRKIYWREDDENVALFILTPLYASDSSWKSRKWADPCAEATPTVSNTYFSSLSCFLRWMTCSSVSRLKWSSSAVWGTIILPLYLGSRSSLLGNYLTLFLLLPRWLSPLTGSTVLIETAAFSNCPPISYGRVPRCSRSSCDRTRITNYADCSFSV